VQVNFDGITYAKGGSVLKQLVAWVGQEQFLAGVAAYFKKHAHSNTELSDLLSELETTSGRDLSDWSQKWLETAGVNTLRPEIEVDAAGVITAFAVLQSAPADYPTIRPHRLAIGVYSADDTALVRTLRVEIDVDGERTEVPELVGADRGDLILLNDDDLAYAKIRLDETSLKTAIATLRTIESPLARALVWGAAWDATRDAEVSASDYIELVLANIATEDESTTLRTTLNQLVLAVKQYLPEAARPTTLRRIGDALWGYARQAEPGSDAQFQFVKFFAHLPSSEGHFDTIRALLDGKVALDGLEIDTDLSWELLEGLVLGGRAGLAEIDAALENDNTATGQQAAARARATIDTAEAKLAAFTEVAAPDSKASNLIVRAVGLGFQHVNDPASLSAVVDAYFASLNDVWANKSYSIASTIITGLYPAPLADEALVAATQAWLDANPETPALRRLVKENLAGVERALAVQQA
jgi:aminopeptidase N